VEVIGLKQHANNENDMPIPLNPIKWFKRRQINVPSVSETNTSLTAKESPKQGKIIGDNPIQLPEEDVIGRTPAAQSFVRQVLALDTSEGIVVGVLGAWGSGKTSFVNLARHEFEAKQVAILDFNPWMFSGAEQLVESFFVELASQLRILPGLAGVGKDIEEYGEVFSGAAWLPFIGPWIEHGSDVAKGIGQILQHRKEGIGKRRKKLKEALSKLEKPIVVVIDDIDRLSTSEIRDIFKLVRLTANFPNIVYVVAFDRERVETALAEQNIPGRDYLEKILQIAIDLPIIPGHVLNQQIFSAMDKALASTETTIKFDDQVWPDIFMEIIRPLIKNMRDVRRYAAAIHGTVETINGQIALADLLALEAIRVFLPDVFKFLHSSIDGLTTTSGATYGMRSDPPQLKLQVENLINNAGTQTEVVRSMIERLFPAAKRHLGGSNYGGDWKSRWLRERRVAHEDILRLYLERVAGEGLLAYTDAEHVWPYMSRRDLLERYFSILDADRLQDVIAALEVYEEQFTPEQVVPSCIVLLNIMPTLPQRQRGMFDFGTDIAVTRVVYRLVRSLADPDVVEAKVHQILPELGSLSAKMALIEMVGHQKDIGHKLISEDAAKKLEDAWLDEVMNTSANKLATEHSLIRIILLTKRRNATIEKQFNIDNSPELTIAILRAAKSDSTSQTFGSRAIRRRTQLAWNVLIEIYNDEETLKTRIESLRKARLDNADEVLELADKYLSGWRPSEFGES
jgi:KAP family P-loop domain